MPWFIKTEHFNTETVKLLPELRKKYISEICDGTQWELRIKRKGRSRIKIFGSNAYPQPKGTFNYFVKAINKLSRSKIEFEEEEY